MGTDPQSQDDSTKSRNYIGDILLAPVKVGVVLLVILSAIGYLGGISTRCELACHFKLQYLIGSVICLVLLLIGKSKRWSAVAGFVVVANAAVVVPWFLPGDTSASNNPGQPLKLLVTNVLTSNTDHAKLYDLIEKEQPDVVIVLEVNDQWQAALQPLAQQMPVHITQPRADNFGIGLFSKLPIDDLAIMPIPGTDKPSIRGHLPWGGRSITLIATHPVPPIRPDWVPERIRHMQGLGQIAQQVQGPLVIAGDFNNTMWSPVYQDFMKNLPRMRNSRKGFGVLGTWPTSNGTAWLMIPIDHCLVSEDLAVIDCRTGPNIGSDHLPLIITLGGRREWYF